MGLTLLDDGRGDNDTDAPTELDGVTENDRCWLPLADVPNESVIDGELDAVRLGLPVFDNVREGDTSGDTVMDCVGDTLDVNVGGGVSVAVKEIVGVGNGVSLVVGVHDTVDDSDVSLEGGDRMLVCPPLPHSPSRL